MENDYNNYLSLNPIATLSISMKSIIRKKIKMNMIKGFHAKTILLENITLNEDNESSLSTLSVTVKRYPVYQTNY